MTKLIKTKVIPILLIMVLAIGVVPFMGSTGVTYAATDEIVYANSIADAGEDLRAEMVKRNASPVIYYKAPLTFDTEEIKGFVKDIFQKAVMHTGNPKEGDYLDYLWESWGSNISASAKGDYLCLKITYNIKYYTTASQEAKLDTEIKNLKAKLNIDSKSNYGKIKAIYDYMCSNIKYDYTHKGDESYGLQYTAYAALINKTSVCQGYATLFYRLALEYGIDARIIEGTGGGENHGWNIVKVGGNYYYLDATWDAGKSTYNYFLKGTDNWVKHTADDRFKTSAFKSKYNIPADDYTYLAAPNASITIVTSTGKPKVSWNKVNGAESYEVWRRVGSSGEYSKYYTTTATYMTNTSTTPGTIYYYKVRAVKGSNVSSFSNVVYKACDLPQPKNVTIEPVLSTGKPLVDWDPVEGASKYEVWRRVGSSGEYVRYYTTTATYMTNTSTTPGTIYYYKVRAICESNSGGNSAFSDVVYMACDLPKPKNINIATVASSGKPRVTWDAVDGASSYEVWRKVGSSGSYEKIYTTTGTSLTNISTTPGKTYYYKIKAICGSNSGGNSAFSDYVYITCDLPKPSAKIELNSSGKPKVSWNKIDGASKYEVYRRVGTDGEYSKYYTTTATYMNNTSATAGKTYYYKVIAVCEASTYGNSAYSNVVYATSK